ncbi:phosphatases II [Marasmius fiardii PR-910]|nr:phosphatases II [Marasmius fiardii PR-910]
MIRFDNLPPEVMQAMCTPMHCILGPPSSSPPALNRSYSSSKSPYPTPPHSSSPSPYLPAHSLPTSNASLFLGSLSAIEDPSMLRQHRISVVVQVIDAPWVPPLDEREFTCYKIPVMDATSVDLTPYLEGVCSFIEGSLRSGRGVLVHCQQGVSRSTAIVIAYLIRFKFMSYDQAFDLVLKRRPCVKPNSGFVAALREWENLCRQQRSRGGAGQSQRPIRPELPRRFTS